MVWGTGHFHLRKEVSDGHAKSHEQEREEEKDGIEMFMVLVTAEPPTLILVSASPWSDSASDWLRALKMIRRPGLSITGPDQADMTL